MSRRRHPTLRGGLEHIARSNLCPCAHAVARQRAASDRDREVGAGSSAASSPSTLTAAAAAAVRIAGTTKCSRSRPRLAAENEAVRTLIGVPRTPRGHVAVSIGLRSFADANNAPSCERTDPQTAAFRRYPAAIQASRAECASRGRAPFSAAVVLALNIVIYVSSESASALSSDRRSRRTSEWYIL
jgi:hypothetical protein